MKNTDCSVAVTINGHSEINNRNSLQRQQLTAGLCNEKVYSAVWWWRMPVILALGRQGQVDLCEFDSSLVYKS